MTSSRRGFLSGGLRAAGLVGLGALACDSDRPRTGFLGAMERVNGYLASRPKDARGRFLKGLILTEQNKPNEAIKVFTELSQDYPGSMPGAGRS